MASRILVTGGAGFIGSSLALSLARDRVADQVIALDNLKRRGSELALDRLRAGGVIFQHGDVRNPEDLERVGRVDHVLECSAEPSVQAGYDEDPRYLVHTNLLGTIHCLEFARRHAAHVIFFSTSRVYPIAPLRDLPLERRGDRFCIPAGRSGPGWSERGIRTEFPLAGARSLYGTTKLCSELLVQEYAETYGLTTVINRCGVVSGPWQMARLDQGFVALWAARSLYGAPLEYIGFGGEGLQVRDVLHVDDLYDLVARELEDPARHRGRLYGVGGGPERSVSLRELSALCAEAVGRELTVGSRPETHPADVPYHVTDIGAVSAQTGWKPHRAIETTVADLFGWLREFRAQLEPIFTSR
ncbi:MAG: NAD-dependent epimerase/dehydratase family protein [Deltaproteobacteria bacterium]|nr:MAG: NAD-dependent epimerase/dehydratase family protein [Deltaproteobacteria bacterium]